MNRPNSRRMTYNDDELNQSLLSFESDLMMNKKDKYLNNKHKLTENQQKWPKKYIFLSFITFIIFNIVYILKTRNKITNKVRYNNVTMTWTELLKETIYLSKELDQANDLLDIHNIRRIKSKNDNLTEMNYINELMKKKEEKYTPQKMYIISLADTFKPQACYIASATAKYGYELKILAWNHSTFFFDNTSCGAPCGANLLKDVRQGQQKKLFWMHHFLQNIHKQGINEDDLLVFTDAYDVIIQNDLSLIRERYLSQTRGRRGVIFNGEPTCGDSFTLPGKYGDRLRTYHFDIKLQISDKVHSIKGTNMCSAIGAKTKLHTPDLGPNYSLGSGGFVGDVQTIRSFYENIMKVRTTLPEHEGDQILFQLAYLRYPELNVFIDVRAEIFFVLSYLIQEDDFQNYSPFIQRGCLRDYMVDGKGSVLKPSRVTPIFFHFPGDYKFFYKTCITNPRKQVLYDNVGKTFYDVDRNKSVPIHSMCPEYT